MSSKVKRFLLILAGISLFGMASFGQSRVVDDYRQSNTPEMKLFFYKSTLRMYAKLQKQLQEKFLDQDIPELPQLSEMISGIEKVKFYNYAKDSLNTRQTDLEKLSTDVLEEGYEEMATARMEGNQLTIFMLGESDQPDGFLIFTRMENGFTIIDIEGSPNFNQLFNFSTYLNKSSSSLSLSGILN